MRIQQIVLWLEVVRSKNRAGGCDSGFERSWFRKERCLDDDELRYIEKLD